MALNSRQVVTFLSLMSTWSSSLVLSRILGVQKRCLLSTITPLKLFIQAWNWSTNLHSHVQRLPARDTLISSWFAAKCHTPNCTNLFPCKVKWVKLCRPWNVEFPIDLRKLL